MSCFLTCYRTHKALVESDNITGRKSINQYEVIEEIGRGMHGKVKLARNLETSDNVAIKIIPRFSKKRRLGKVTAMSPQDKTKKEIAILKKIRHPNVVALLEVIDDPELKKIYMVLEHVELGEIVWRKKGLPHVCQYERRRIERELRGEAPSAEEERYDQMLERRQAIKEIKRAKMAMNFAGPTDYWSVEHGAADEHSSVGQWSRISSREDFAAADGSPSLPLSRQSSGGPSRSYSISSSVGAHYDEHEDAVDWPDDMVTPGALHIGSNSANAADGAMYGSYADEGAAFRVRSPSMADSIISHMSSIDYNPRMHDPFADDFSYVPCFTFDQARSAFRDTVLGLEYLHYQGVVHRDIKPANLLWSKDHRVKISDFGVSYFGRPIREGEPDDLVSESEARDFDDDLELAKTVGTPAFFAPELCYTDPEKEQLKVSEQIDVWSLGVTLYCLIYARIPFLAEDEFQMFRKIANEDVLIPRRRLKPVDPSTSPSTMSLYKRQNTYPYRDDNDVEYEDVDSLLYDLLRLMLIKNPEKRIRLRDIKRHPWVVQGLANPIGWLDDTDPARPSCGRKIQVDERDMSSAVVPLTFLERARSVVKKAVGKVMHPLADRSDSRSRRRANSSAASSAGDSVFKNTAPATPLHNPERRRSLVPDDYFAGVTRENYSGYITGPPTASSQTETVAYDPMATVLQPLTTSSAITRGRSHSELVDATKPEFQPAPPRPIHRHSALHGRRSHQFLNLTPYICGPQTMPPTPSYDGHRDYQWDGAIGAAGKMRDMTLRSEDPSRSQSVDRSIFSNLDKRANPQVSLSTAMAPGNIQTPRNPRAMRSVDLGRNRYTYGLSSSPLSSSPKAVSTAAYQHRQPQSDPNFNGRQYIRPDERPQTAQRVEVAPNLVSLLTSDLFKLASDSIVTAQTDSGAADASSVACPPSPPMAEETNPPTHSRVPSGWNTMTTAKTASTDSMDCLATPLTSPSEMASPESSCPPTKSPSQRILAFQSDPSLPALLSGASSVSADLEGELLGKPGIVSGQPSLLETTDSLTPPAMVKEPASGFPMDQVFTNAPAMESGPLALHLEPTRPSTSHTWELGCQKHDDADDHDDSGSDDEDMLVMAKSKKKPPTVPPYAVRRRDTNMSTASDETAKKVIVYNDEGGTSQST